ncbi:MAG: GxxExxY protein [Candidatus Methylacidiphilales bacterium]|nr:GxxExxY protein [Candidatus Methylacidiphilales bacterium]
MAFNQESTYAKEIYEINGAVYEVYRQLGFGFVESVYQECLEREFIHRSIVYESQKQLNIFYRGEKLLQYFRADFICYGKIILEVKAVDKIAPEHFVQVRNYIKSTGYDFGLIVNFGSYPKAVTRSVVL